LQETELDGTIIYHAGTTTNEQNEVVTNGGRVLAVTSFGDDIKGAVQQSNYVLSQLYFENMYFRTDIGYEFM
jgi:phosphoribosylamine---glycine ligase